MAAFDAHDASDLQRLGRRLNRDADGSRRTMSPQGADDPARKHHGGHRGGAGLTANEQALLDRQAAVLEPSAADAGQEAAASAAAPSAAGGAVAASTASTAGAASASGESVQAPR